MALSSVNKLQKFATNLISNFSDIVQEVKESREHAYAIAGWTERESVGKDSLIYRVVGTDKYISSFSVVEVYNNDEILLGFSKQEIKYISTLAMLLAYKKSPKYKVVWRGFRESVGGQVIHLSDRDNPGIIKANIEELEKNISILEDMDGKEAFSLGKEVGVICKIKEEEEIKAIMREK